MIRIYRFSIWLTPEVKQLYDGLFDNAAEALGFYRDNMDDPDVLWIRIDAIDFLADTCIDREEWTTDSPWWHRKPLTVIDKLGRL